MVAGAAKDKPSSNKVPGRDETSFESCVLTLELNEGKGI